MKILKLHHVLSWLILWLIVLPVQAEPYRLIAGSSELGFRENDKQNIQLGFKSIFNTLLSSNNVESEFISFDNSAELAYAIANDKVNAFFGSSIELLASESSFLSSAIASGVFDSKTKSRILLLVRKDSGINTLAQLKGKKLSLEKWGQQDIIGLYIETLLLEHRLPNIKTFFSEVQYSKTSNTALVNLFFKKSDAALVSESQFRIATELNPQLLHQTKILEASDPHLIFVAALSKNTPAPVVDAVRQNLLTFHKTAKGRNLLNLIKMDGFREISITDLDSVRALLAKNQKLKAKQNVH